MRNALSDVNVSLRTCCYLRSAPLTKTPACKDSSHVQVQVWLTAHQPKRGRLWMGTRPMVHTGFYKAWTAKGLDLKVIGHIQAMFLPSAALPRPERSACSATCLAGADSIRGAQAGCQGARHGPQVSAACSSP